METTTSTYAPIKGLSFATVMQEMTTAGFPPAASAQVALGMTSDAKSMGGWRVYQTLVGSGLSKRQAIKQIRSMFGAKTAKTVMNAAKGKK